MTAQRLVGNEAAAAHIGVAASTWRAYVARGHAPEPIDREVSKTGHALPVWSSDDLDAWQAERRGQAWRRGETSADQPR